MSKFPDHPLAKWIQLLVAVILVPIMAWGFSAYINHETRLTTIEATCFTSEDALEVYRVLSSKADREDVPPQEVRDTLARQERLMERLDNRLSQHIEGHP